MSANTTAEELVPGYSIRRGVSGERAMLVKFLRQSYEDAFPHQDFSHLERTVEKYFSAQTPFWWVEEKREEISNLDYHRFSAAVACLWMGNAIDQVSGDRHAHIFLLYVVPEHRRKGIGRALMQHAEQWALKRGDRQIGLQVFSSNQAALHLYHQLGYRTQSFWMLKPLYPQT